MRELEPCAVGAAEAWRAMTIRPAPLCARSAYPGLVLFGPWFGRAGSDGALC